MAHDPPTPEELAALRVEAARLFEDMPWAHPVRGVVAGGTGTNINRLLGRVRAAVVGPSHSMRR